MRRNGKSHAWGDPYILVCPNAPLSSATLFGTSPATGHLSTVPEFGGVLIGQLDKYLAQNEVQAAIRELGGFWRSNQIADLSLFVGNGELAKRGSPPP
jgi:hypothetical protein